MSLRQFFSPRGVFRPHNLAVMAMMVALRFILARFTIQLTPNLKLFTMEYLPAAIVGSLYGPWAALAFGFASDTAGFLANGTSGYFPGYAISEMVSGFLYACFLYGRPVFRLRDVRSLRNNMGYLARIALARLLILVVVIMGLNYLWQSMLWGAVAGDYYSKLRLLNNLIQFVPSVAFIAISCHAAALARSLVRRPLRD